MHYVFQGLTQELEMAAFFPPVNNSSTYIESIGNFQLFLCFIFNSHDYPYFSASMRGRETHWKQPPHGYQGPTVKPQLVVSVLQQLQTMVCLFRGNCLLLKGMNGKWCEEEEVPQNPQNQGLMCCYLSCVYSVIGIPEKYNASTLGISDPADPWFY